MVLASFILSAGIFLQHGDGSETVFVFDWIKSGSLSIPFSFLIDSVSITMLLIVTGVGFLIHVYSIGYMKEDEGYSRFFSYLNLFVFFMLLLVLGSNYVVLFAGWEGVGLCSYLLIGFWYTTPEFNYAGRKAFVMNRIGDIGMVLAMALMFYQFGTLNYVDVMQQGAAMAPSNPLIVTAAEPESLTVAPLSPAVAVKVPSVTERTTVIASAPPSTSPIDSPVPLRFRAVCSLAL